MVLPLKCYTGVLLPLQKTSCSLTSLPSYQEGRGVCVCVYGMFTYVCICMMCVCVKYVCVLAGMCVHLYPLSHKPQSCFRRAKDPDCVRSHPLELCHQRLSSILALPSGGLHLSTLVRTFMSLSPISSCFEISRQSPKRT